MLIDVTTKPTDTRNYYVLFGWEAVQARPNLDPYSGTLRMNDETGQVFTSDVHLKHHVRRGLQAELQATTEDPNRFSEAIFYQKSDKSGQSVSFAERLTVIRQHNQRGAGDRYDALNYCIDTPLFGYVHAVSKESFNVINAANTLFRPVTFHQVSISQLGRNNAFPGEGKASAGSASVDTVEYGFFLALWEVSAEMLEINAKDNKMLPWASSGVAGWLSLLCSGMWRAYSTDRYPSFTQRAQFAKFLMCWNPERQEIAPAMPHDLIFRLKEEERGAISGSSSAIVALKKLLPEFCSSWGCSRGHIRAERYTPDFADIEHVIK